MKKNNYNNIYSKKKFIMKSNKFLEHKHSIRLTEKFDVNALKIIINEFDFFKDQMRESCFRDDNYDPLNICKKYLSGSKNGVFNTSYRYSNKNKKYTHKFIIALLR